MKRLLVSLCLLLIATAAFAAPRAQAPNLSVYVGQRIFLPNKPGEVSLSTYNLHSATLAVYRSDIEDIIPNASVLLAPDDRKNPNSVAARLEKLRLSRPVKSWPVRVKVYYPNNWNGQAVKLPKLAPGVYVLQASGGGVVKRTWFAVSNRALLVHRSPDAVKAWLVRADNGTPIAGATLALYDEHERVKSAVTGKDGLATFTAPIDSRLLWVAARGGEPAFARATAPYKPKPYLVYLYTDRPLYRPGQLVRFRGTVRAVNRGVYSQPADKTVHVQIKTKGDTVVYDKKLTLNEFGTFVDDFQLAPEPPLGRYTLEVALSDYREYHSFEVQAYRKPEYDVTVTIPKTHYLGTETIPVTIGAKYFFGGAVSGAKVTYRVNFDEYGNRVPTHILTAAGLGSAAQARMEESFSGQGRLDADGKLLLEIPTRSVPFDRYVSVNAQVTDLSLRMREGEANTMISAALFRMSIYPEKYQYQPGNEAKINVYTYDFDDKPVSVSTTVTLIETLKDREGRYYEQRTKHLVTTDKDGRTFTTFKVVRPGSFRVEAWARDTQGNAVYAETNFEVSKEKPQPDWPTLETTLDKGTYVPGEVAQLRVRTSLVNSFALLTITGERLYRIEVVKLAGKDFKLPIHVLKDYQPGVRILLTVIRNGQRVCSDAYLYVPANDKRLSLSLIPSKTTYKPGEEATYTINARDGKGRGVATELGLGLVDAALYALMDDSTADPFDVFWGGQNSRVTSDFSHEAAYPGGGYQRMTLHGAFMSVSNALVATAPATYALGAADSASPAPAPPRVRQNFVDTAYWGPSVITDADGYGKVSFTVPDNLTTWRAIGRGITRDTMAGEARVDVKVTLPLLVRLTVPRFYVRGDEVTVAAIAHNYTGAEKQTKVTLSAEGGQLLDEAAQTVALPADGIKRLTWKMKVTGVTQQASDHVRLLVSADGGDDAKDAVENTVPVFPDGVKRVEANAGMSGESAAFAMTLPENAVPGSAQLELSLSPSLAGPIFEALDYLVAYPHGCAEQTMSRFLPAIIVERTLRELGAKRPAPKMLDRYVSFGLQKLLRYQHGDGGWHWWEFDESDPYITAYIVYGLAMARDAGYPLAAGPLPRGADYLSRALRNEQDRIATAYLLWALAYADVWNDDSIKTATVAAQRLIAEQDKLDTFSKASLALALERLSKQKGTPGDFAAKAKALADKLEASAIMVGNSAHWTANASGGGSWLDSDVEVTAQVLQALLVLKPNSTKIVPAVRWMMAARHGTQWNSTKDTSAAVLALTAYLKQAKELAPEETVTVKVGDKTVQTLQFGAVSVFADPVRITVSAADLKSGSNSINLEKQGPGNLYWTAHLRYVVPAEGIEPQSNGIKLTRRYRVLAEDPVTAGVQPAGSMIEVTVDLEPAQNFRYVVLEEPVPAGCEIVGNDDDNRPMRNWDDYGRPLPCFDNREVWDDRIVYYFDYLPKGGMTITYWLRAEAPGAYRIRPGAAECMYFPDVRGEERLVRLKVSEE